MKICLFIFFIFAPFAHAAPLDDARDAFNQGRYSAAISSWRSAPARNLGVQLQTWRGMASAYWQLGQFQAAQSILEQALRLARKNQADHAQVLLLNEFSKLYLAKGEQAQAGKYLQQALEMAQTLEATENSTLTSDNKNTHKLLAELFNQQGNWLNITYDYNGALAAYAKALANADKDELHAKIQVNRVQTLYEQALFNLYPGADMAHLFQPIIQALQKTLPLVQGWQDQYSEVLALVKLGKLAGDIRTQLLTNEASATTVSVLDAIAKQTLQRAIKSAEHLQHPHAKAYAYGYLGRHGLHTGNIKQALSLTRRALFFTQQSGSNKLEYLWHRQLGQLFKHQGKLDAATNAYRQAITSFTPVRARDATTGYCAKTEGFRERIAPVYFELADLLLQQARITSDDRQRDKLQRDARSSIESFKSADLQAYFQDDCIIMQQQPQAVETWLDEHTAILYPIVLEDRLELLLGFQDGLFQVMVPVSHKQLRKAAHLLLAGLRHHPAPATRGSIGGAVAANCSPGVRGTMPMQTDTQVWGFLEHAQVLYQWLIEPLREALDSRGINTLVIAPDGALRTIPFAALHDGEHFAIEQYALAVVPSLTLSTKQSASPPRQRALLAGLSEPNQGFSALPCVEYEVQHLHKLYQSSQDTLLNQAFKVSEMAAVLDQEDHSLVHIATHGQFSGNLEQTFLLTYEGKLRLNQLEQLLESTNIAGTQIDLLTLSACETATGNDRAALGLAGIALKAGVNSALASLWKVDDVATPAVILEFYRQWHTGITKARALQQAQIKMLKSAEFVRYRHPYYWSAFLLIGGWL